MEQIQKSEAETVDAHLSVAPLRQYSGWLISNKFYKRSLAVVGHYLIGTIMISLGLLVVALVFSILITPFN